MLQQLDTLIGFAVVMSVVSLLITIITQMISSLLGLRGSNLADGLEAMLHKLAPDLDEKVRTELIEHILTRPMISDSMMSMSETSWDKIPILAWFRNRWKKASAIRPEELMEALKDVAKVTPDLAKATLAALSKTPDQPTSLKEAALTVLGALHVTTPATDAKVAVLNSQLPGLAQADQLNATAVIAQLNDATNVSLGNLEKLFNASQDRAQQWFAMHTRFWTVVASLVMAFVLQLDTLRLITKLSSDPAERAKLIQFSQTTLQKKADEVYTNSLSSAAIYKKAIEGLPGFTNGTSSVKIASALTTNVFDTLGAAENWLNAQADTNHLDSGKVLAAFRTAVNTATKENYKQVSGEFGSLTDAFAQTGVQLMQNPYPPVFTREWELWSWPWEWRMSGQWSWPASHLFGILISAALLSLGAPFWFNSLKALANLRPMLATEIDEDEKAKAKKVSG